VGFLGDFAPGLFRVIKSGVAFKAQNIERNHLITAAAAIAGPGPAIMCGFLVA
jgi:hypothetical protein